MLPGVAFLATRGLMGIAAVTSLALLPGISCAAHVAYGGSGSGVGLASQIGPAAAPGAVLWARSYNGPGIFKDFASAVAVSPDGRAVFVTGRSADSQLDADYATVAYNAATGALAGRSAPFRSDRLAAIS